MLLKDCFSGISSSGGRKACLESLLEREYNIEYCVIIVPKCPADSMLKTPS